MDPRETEPLREEDELELPDDEELVPDLRTVGEDTVAVGRDVVVVREAEDDEERDEAADDERETVEPADMPEEALPT